MARWRKTHPPGNQHQKVPICLWVAGEVNESLPRAKQVALFPLGPLPNTQCHNTVTWVAHPGKYLRLCPLLCKRYTQTKKIWPK